MTSASADSALDRVVESATRDLAARLGISESSIAVLAAESKTWPDRGLGCPQPGVAYPQVRVDGALVQLGVGDRVYRYHSGAGRAPFLCSEH